MSCDRRCFDPQSKWFDHENCDTCPGKDAGQKASPAYRLSTDYDELFRLICCEEIVVGFVDYRFDRFNQAEVPMRDVVQIRRDGEYSIFIGARGISYGNVYSWMRQHGPEHDVFVGVCQSINLAFIPAQPKG